MNLVKKLFLLSYPNLSFFNNIFFLINQVLDNLKKLLLKHLKGTFPLIPLDFSL